MIKVEAPLNNIPLFVVAGCVLPTRKKAGKNVEETESSDYEFLAFGEKEDETCEGLLYLDDGQSRDYQAGHYGLYRVTSQGIQNLVEGDGWDASSKSSN